MVYTGFYKYSHTSMGCILIAASSIGSTVCDLSFYTQSDNHRPLFGIKKCDSNL